MSVLVFVEDSHWLLPGSKDYYASVAGAAIAEASYDDFSRRLLRLKEKFFKRQGIADYPLRGRDLLHNRALNSGYRKVEFVGELFSLCRLQKVTAFSATKRFTAQSPVEGVEELPPHMQKSAISSSDRYSEQEISLLLAYLIEHVNFFMLERYLGQTAKLIFKTRETRQDYELCSSIMNFIYRTPFGGGFRGILGTPLLMPARLSPGLQVADLFAYVVNQHAAGRREMDDFFAEVEEMQFVSRVEKDEYQLKGINLLE